PAVAQSRARRSGGRAYISSPFERLLHCAHPLLDHAGNGFGEVVGQQVCNPHDATAPAFFDKNLQRRVVMLRSAFHHGPHETAGSIVDIHDELAGSETVGDSHDPPATCALEPSVAK